MRCLNLQKAFLALPSTASTRPVGTVGFGLSAGTVPSGHAQRLSVERSDNRPVPIVRGPLGRPKVLSFWVKPTTVCHTPISRAREGVPAPLPSGEAEGLRLPGASGVNPVGAPCPGGGLGSRPAGPAAGSPSAGAADAGRAGGVIAGVAVVGADSGFDQQRPDGIRLPPRAGGTRVGDGRSSEGGKGRPSRSASRRSRCGRRSRPACP